MPQNENDYVRHRVALRNTNGKLYRKICKIYNHSCAVCGWSLPTRTPDGRVQRQGGCDLHHIVQKKDGGGETIENLILLCPNCHSAADAKIFSEAELRARHRTTEPSGIEWLNMVSRKWVYRSNEDGIVVRKPIH